MKIVRTEYVKLTRVYILEITSELLDDITESLKRHAHNPNDVPTITEDYVREAMDFNDGDEKNIEIAFNGWENSTYTADLFDMLRDYLNDYIWEADSEEVDWETEDHEDEIVD